jgi:hypothetical protein
MLKQSSNRMKKGIAVLFVVLFVASLTAVTVSAKGGSYWRGYGNYGGHGHYGGYGDWGYGDWGWGPGWGYGLGAYPYMGVGVGCYIVNGALVCPTHGYPNI